MSNPARNLNDEVPFVLPINLTEMMTALLGTDRASGYVKFDNTTISPLTSITYTIPIPDLQASGDKVTVVGIPFEFTAAPEYDNVLSLEFFVDKNRLIVDTSMVASLYTEPMNLLKDYALTWYAKDTFQAKFTNLDPTTSCKISFRFVFAVMRYDDYKTIIEAYAERIKMWLLERSTGGVT